MNSHLRHLAYALLLAVSLSTTMAHLWAYQGSLPAPGGGEITLLKWAAEQGALTFVLVVVFYFYRRDFANQHAQDLQQQAILITALNTNTAAMTALQITVKEQRS